MGKVHEYFVSAEGNDEWSGTLENANSDMTDGPFASLGRARKALRGFKKKGPAEGVMNVSVRGGFYVLEEPLAFCAEDSGSESLEICYRAYKSEKPVISGGRKIDSWEKGGGGVWHADASKLKGADGFCRQLFVNGVRRPRSSMPVQGFYFTKGSLPPAGEPLKFNFNKGDLKKEWADGNSEMLILEKWFELRHDVKEIDEKNSEVILPGVSRTHGGQNLRYRLENAREGLDVPGTWFYDRFEKLIFYRPLPGEDMNNIEAVVPCLTTLIDFAGEIETGRIVNNIRFSGFTFCHTAWELPEDGYNGRQAAYDIPAAVNATGSRGCSFEECRLIHLGGYGIEWGPGCEDNSVIECEISDAGAGGVKVGSPEVFESKNDLRISSKNRVEKCSIHNIGHVYPEAVGVWIGQSCENTISHNHIYDTYYSGISSGWTWGYRASRAGNNIIEYNHIHDISRGVLCDLAGIYTLGAQHGTVIRRNIIHDVASYSYGGHGIYLDEGTSGVLVENNLVYRTKDACFYQHYGKDNIIKNNIFAFGETGIVKRLREEDHISFNFTNNIVCASGGPFLCGAWTNNNYKLDNNVYFSKNGGRENFCRNSINTGIKRCNGRPELECGTFDAVRITPGAGREPKFGDKIRFLGNVPEVSLTGEEFPGEDEWSGALMLPGMIVRGGGKVKNGETLTGVLRDKRHVYIRFLCGKSEYFHPRVGSGPEKYERVEIILKPSISDESHVHLALTVEGVENTIFRPPEAWNLFRWEWRIKQVGEGWEAILKIKIEDIGVGKDGVWQLFAGRFFISHSSFSEWLRTGQDSHSIFSDPLFISPEEGDFRLRKSSPALEFVPGAEIAEEL